MTKQRRDKIISRKVKSLKRIYEKYGSDDFGAEAKKLKAQLGTIFQDKRTYSSKLEQAQQPIKTRSCSYKEASRISVATLISTTLAGATIGATVGQEVALGALLGALSSTPISVVTIDTYEGRPIAKTMSYFKQKYYGSKLKALEDKEAIAQGTLDKMPAIRKECEEEICM